MGKAAREVNGPGHRATPPVAPLPASLAAAQPSAATRPRVHVHVNCAASLDGKLAWPDGAAMPLSDEVDWRRVHVLRSKMDAILVGVGTILGDDPSLTVKEEYAPRSPTRHLLRVVLDAKGRTPRGARVATTAGPDAPTLILTGPGVEGKWPKAQHKQVPLDPATGHLELAKVLEVLETMGVRDLLVEGGAAVLRSFLDSPFVERWTLYVAPVLVGGTGPSIFSGRPSNIGRRLHVENVEPQGKGVLWTLRP